MIAPNEYDQSGSGQDDDNDKPPLQSDATRQGDGNSEPSILAPPIDKDGELDTEADSVASIQQALMIAGSLEKENFTRASRCAIIQQVHDMAPPRSFAEKQSKGKAWQANFSTGWLAGIVTRNQERLVNSIITAPILTHSSLPATFPNYQEITDLLRGKFTKLFREWPKFSSFLSSVANETALQGYNLPVFLDPWTPWPTFFKQEKTNVPNGAPMYAGELQLLSVSYDYPVQDFINLFRDQPAAQDAGYDLPNCMAAANKSVVDNPSKIGDSIVNPRAFVDFVNQGVLGAGYSGSGQRVVRTWLLFNVEYDKTVSFWILGRDAEEEKALLRFKRGFFKTMDDVTTMFTFGAGNGCIHSSKGIGRMLLNMTLAIEKTRNQLSDNAYLSSLLILMADSAQRSRMNPTIVSPFIVVDKGIELGQQRFNLNSEGLIDMDRLFTSYAEQGAGAAVTDVINPNSNQTEKTATQARIDTARSQESSVMLVARFDDAFFTLMGASMRRAYCQENLRAARGIYRKILANPKADRLKIYEGDAHADSACLQNIVEIYREWPVSFDPNDDAAMDEVIETILAFRESPSTIRAHVLETLQMGAVAQLYQAFPNDPMFNQPEMKKIIATNMVGAKLAQQLLIPTPDYTLVAEAQRQQMSESATMKIIPNTPVPVSPLDNHVVHCQWLQQKLTAAAPVLSATVAIPPDAMQWITDNLNHFGAHMDMAMQGPQAGLPAIKALEKFYLGFKKQFQQVVQIQQEAKIAHAIALPRARQLAAQGASQQASGGQAPAPSPTDNPSPDGVTPSIPPAQVAAPPAGQVIGQAETAP